MLLMLAVGVGNFGWMLVQGALMAIEKNLSWGRCMSAPLGVVLIAWGVVLLLASSYQLSAIRLTVTANS